MSKLYHAERGVLLDGDFNLHANNCASCAQFNAEKPATAALLCLEGSVLWKRKNHEPQPRKKEFKPETVRSSKEVKAAMKYK